MSEETRQETGWENALTLDTQTTMLDTRDDVFALGGVAFRALTGVMPGAQSTREARGTDVRSSVTHLPASPCTS